MLKTKQILDQLRPDFEHVVRMVEDGSRVLDLGCGDGRLLERLVKEKNAKGLGVEIDENNIVKCIGKGLSVFQGDIDEGLSNYPDNSYDYVILNQTLQVTLKPEYVLREMLRVGKRAIISFPNFAYWKIRLHLLFTGRMPKSELLPFEWYNTPNIHLLSIKDFIAFCAYNDWTIIRNIFISNSKDWLGLFGSVLPNMLAEEAIFMIAKKI